MPQYTTKQDFLHYNILTSHFTEYSSGYLLFNMRVWKHGNQGPWFGENCIIAKKPERDQLGTLTQPSPKTNQLLIMNLICIEWKSSRFLFPGSMVAARYAWEPILSFVS